MAYITKLTQKALTRRKKLSCEIFSVTVRPSSIRSANDINEAIQQIRDLAEYVYAEIGDKKLYVNIGDIAVKGIFVMRCLYFDSVSYRLMNVQRITDYLIESDINDDVKITISI